MDRNRQVDLQLMCTCCVTVACTLPIPDGRYRTSGDHPECFSGRASVVPAACRSPGRQVQRSAKLRGCSTEHQVIFTTLDLPCKTRFSAFLPLGCSLFYLVPSWGYALLLSLLSVTTHKPATSSCRLFRKGGTMTALGEYVAESSRTPAPVKRKPASNTTRLGPQIASSNVGYQLLRKAGWQEGQGIGINQQGRPIPLSAYHQQARHGIGAETKHASGKQPHQERPGRKRRAKEGNEAVSTAKQREQQPVPDVPENPAVKRQRHQQVSSILSVIHSFMRYTCLLPLASGTHSPKYSPLCQLRSTS